MTLTTALLGFAVVAAVLTLVPGLDTALILRSSISRGWRGGLATTLGINAGTLAWGIAAAVGASALLAASTTAYRILTIAGAGYMVYLGASLLWRSWRKTGVAAEQPAAHAEESLWRSALTGFTTNLLNPKIGVFYIATIPQFVPAGASPLVMGVLLALVHAALTLIWAGALIAGTQLARRWLQSPRALRITDRVTGVVLIGMGTKLALGAR
ncbi:MAG: LysE family translocator [Mycetocola sp.]